jgi:hypothetical protein
VEARQSTDHPVRASFLGLEPWTAFLGRQLVRPQPKEFNTSGPSGSSIGAVGRSSQIPLLDSNSSIYTDATQLRNPKLNHHSIPLSRRRRQLLKRLLNFCLAAISPTDPDPASGAVDMHVTPRERAPGAHGRCSRSWPVLEAIRRTAAARKGGRPQPRPHARELFGELLPCQALPRLYIYLYRLRLASFTN